MINKILFIRLILNQNNEVSYTSSYSLRTIIICTVIIVYINLIFYLNICIKIQIKLTEVIRRTFNVKISHAVNSTELCDIWSKNK